MAKVFYWLTLFLLLATVSFSTAEGEQPTYTDCRPHIDATIRDLAAKAVQAGEEPSDPEDLDYGETDQTEIKVEPTVTEPPEVIETLPVTKPVVEPVPKKTDKKGTEKTQVSKNEEKSKRVEKKDKTKEAHKKKSGKSGEDNKSKKSSDEQKSSSQKSSSATKDYKATHIHEKPKNKAPARTTTQPKQHDKRHGRSASRDSEPRKSKEKSPTSRDSSSKAHIGIFDKFIDIVFGLPTTRRHPKFAKPWMTHPEFAKKDTSSNSKTPEKKQQQVSTKPNFISNAINKAVFTVFNIPENPKRSSKWAKPWQTHAEHLREDKGSAKAETKKEVKKKVEPSKSLISFEFVNKFVELIFGHKAHTRDPKYAKPWQTHPEFQSKPVDSKVESKPSKPKPKPSQSHSQGGIINSMISLVFEVPTGKRHEKWAKPWNTHAEFQKKESHQHDVKKASPKPTKVGTESNFIGKFINKFVYTIFGEPTSPRSKKWKQPWNTHAEHLHQTSSKPAKVEKEISAGPGFIARVINKAVTLIFGPVPETRDPKWAKPWTQIKEEEKDRSKKKSTPQPKPETKKRDASPPSKPQAKTPSPPPKPSQKSVSPPPKVKSATPTPVREKTQAPKPKEKSPSREPSRSPSPESTKPQKLESPRPEPSPKKETFPSRPSDTKSRESAQRADTPAKVADRPKAPVKPVLEKTTPTPTKIRASIEDDDVEFVPSTLRSRDHINSILGLDEDGGYATSKVDSIAEGILKDIKKVYESSIKPLETAYKFHDISNRQLTEAEIFGTPNVLLVGPYSTGKSSFINYILGTEFSKRALKTGAPPSHGVFRIIQYGDHDRKLDGTDVGGQSSFTSLQKFGQNFVDQIKGVALNVPLLKKVTFIEAPGVLEMRRPNERLYPLNDVLQWFIDRADLILVMFDYTKLDAGFEMEAILDQLKGRELQTRILLNKADQVPPEELIKVQGSLFWNLSPLLGVNTPPVVYAGSFSSLPYRPYSPAKLFQAQEEALLHDVAKAIGSRVENRIAIARRHAVRVRNHAQMVDTYLNTFRKNKGFLTSKHKLAEDIVENPHEYNIYEGISLQANVSRYDLPDAEVYRDFFRIHNLYDFRTLKETCGFLGGCPMEKLDAAISTQFPQLMTKFRRQLESAVLSAKLPSFKSGGVGTRAAHSQAGKS